MANVPLYVEFVGFQDAPPGILTEVTLDSPELVAVNTVENVVVVELEAVDIDTEVDVEVDEEAG